MNSARVSESLDACRVERVLRKDLVDSRLFEGEAVVLSHRQPKETRGSIVDLGSTSFSEVRLIRLLWLPSLRLLLLSILFWGLCCWFSHRFGRWLGCCFWRRHP